MHGDLIHYFKATQWSSMYILKNKQSLYYYDEMVSGIYSFITKSRRALYIEYHILCQHGHEHSDTS
jgi:hypothetical protein